MSSSNYSCTLHGSYRKHLDYIKLTADVFRDKHIDVLFPQSFEVVKRDSNFVRFLTDTGDDIEIEQRLISLLRSKRHDDSFFAYFLTVGGYIGASAAFELALVREMGVNYFISEQINDLPIHIGYHRTLLPITLATRLTKPETI